MNKNLDSIREWLGRNGQGARGGQVIRAEAHGDTVSLALSGSLTLGKGDVALRQAVEECLEVGAPKLVVDLSDVTTIDSSGIGEIVALYTVTKNHGGTLVLSNLPENIKDILHITGLITIFDAYESIGEAIAALSPKPEGPLADGALYELEEGRENLVIAQPRIIDATDEIIRTLKFQPDNFYKLPPRRFEEVVASLLDDMGLEVHLTGQTRDGGRDILAFLNTEIGRFLCLVEAKRHRRDRKVGVDVVRNLYGVLFHEQANSGLLVTTSDFSADARAFQQEHRYQLHLKGYADLTKWLKAYGSGDVGSGLP